jgi:hypothetical protein
MGSVEPRNRFERSQALVDTLVVITNCDATLSGEFAKRKNVVHSLSKVVGADVAHYLLEGVNRVNYVQLIYRVNRCRTSDHSQRWRKRSTKKKIFRVLTSPYSLFKSPVSSFLLSFESYPTSFESFFHARRSSEYARS